MAPGVSVPASTRSLRALLVDDEARSGIEVEHLARAHQVRVLAIEQLYARLERTAPRRGEMTVLGALLRLGAEAVGVHHHGDVATRLEPPLSPHHRLGELVNNQQL